MGGVDDLELDPRIRDWVLLPIVFIMILVGICRHYAQRLMASENKQDIEQVRQMNTLTRAQRFRTNMGFLTEQAAMGRKSYYAAKKTGVLAQKQKASAAANPAMNPNGMMDMMKNNMSYMIPNIAMMSLVNMFFEGFLIVKVPFALTPRFKMMLQQGIDLKSLSASYVSSLSWYFIVMFGINGFYSLILGGNVRGEEEMMKMQMGMGAGAGMQQFNAGQAFKAERDNINMLQHRHVTPMAERMLVDMPMVDPLKDEAGAAAGGSSKRETIAEKARNARLDAESRSSGLRQRKGARS